MRMMSVCYVCGDKGRVKELVSCVECKFEVSVVHRYCKQLRVEDTASWKCEDCLEQEMIQLREGSRKSSRVQDRWIKKSNYKAIYKPKREDDKGIGLASLCSEGQIASQSSEGSFEDTFEHIQLLEQRKACFRCSSNGSGTELLDCKQCHNFFVHRECKWPQENDCPNWTCDHCMNMESMQLIDPPKEIKKTRRMRAGWVPRKKLSDKHLNLGFQDQIFRKECKARPSKASDRGGASKELIKVPTPEIHSNSIPQNGVHVENRQRRMLVMDSSDIFGDDDHAAKKAIHGQNAQSSNANYRHRQVELGKEKALEKNRASGLDRGRDSSKVTMAQTANSQSTSFSHDVNCAGKMQKRKFFTDYSDIFGDDNQKVDHPAKKAKRRLSQVVRDWPPNAGPRNDTSSDKKRTRQALEPMDQSINGARHDVTGIKCDPVKRPVDNVYAEPIMNPIWQGHVDIQFGSYKAGMELICCRSTKSSYKVAEAVKGLPRTVSFAVKCSSVVWPRRFQMPPLSDKAVDVYMFPKNEKDVAAYDELLDRLAKHNLALLYGMPFKNQNLLIFPSRLLHEDSHRLRQKYYMWGSMEKKGR